MFGSSDTFGRFGGYGDGGGGGRGFSGGDGGFLPPGTFSSQAEFGGGRPSWPHAADSKNNLMGNASGTKHTVPLKVAMVFNAHGIYPQDLRLTVLGMELCHFKLVGRVLDFSVNADQQRLQFTLDDGTGQIRVEWYVGCLCDGPTTPYRQQKFDAIKNNSWVAVYGELNLLGKTEPHVKSLMVRAIENFEEIFYHTVDVAHFICRQQHPDEFTQNVAGGNTTGGNITTGMSAIQIGTDMRTDRFGTGKEQEAVQGDKTSQRVLDILRSASAEFPEGVPVQQLVYRVKRSGFNYFTETHARNILDQLSCEGSAYFSSDPDHWKA